MAEFYRKKKKVCQLCAGRTLNYKDVEIIKRFYINEKGKILPRRATGACARHQRTITTAVKRGRHIAIIPYAQD